MSILFYIFRLVSLAAIIGAFVLLDTATAQAPANPPAAAVASPPQSTPQCPPTNAKVTSVTPAKMEMEDTVIVGGENLASLVTSCPGKDVVLFLNWLPLPDVKAELLGDGTLRFRLLRGTDSQANWDLILGRPRLRPRSLPLGVGYAGGQPLPDTLNVQFMTLPNRGFAGALVTFAVLCVSFGWLAVRSDIIRSGPSDTPGVRGSFSLSKTQAAWWFFVVLGTYLLIGLVTGDFTTSLNTTALGLLALGSGTAVGGALIGASQKGPSTQLKQMVELDKVKAVQAVVDPATQPLAAEAAARAQTVLTNGSQGFLIDILSDADGVCFHRFQIVAWTVVLTGVFINGVYEHLAMPAFDPTLFGLLGLSSLTYLGLKNTEAVVPKTPGP